MKKREPIPMEVSPSKILIEEIDALRKAARAVTSHFLARLDNCLAEIQASAAACAGKDAQSRDLRDMLMLIRSLDLKPAAGRRKDLKKIESAVEELRLLTQKW